jgi:ethanolaminephosphotransferase
MLYGNGYWGVTEANYLLIVINWVTAAIGPWLWASKIRDILHVTPPSWLHPRLAEATVNEAVVTFVVTFGCEQLSGQIYRVFKLTRSMLPVDGRGHKKLGRRVATSHLLQFTLMFGLGAVVTSQHMTAPGQLRAVFACFGIIYALQATRLIMCHMCKEPFEIFWWPITLLVACVANTYLQVLDPALVAWAAVGIALAGYLHYVFSVIDQICGFLGISCLTIPVHDPAAEEKTK